MKSFLFVAAGLYLSSLAFSVYAQNAKKPQTLATKKNEVKKMKDGLYARITTPRGEILARLHVEEAPLTVANFVGLAEGTKDYAIAGKKGAKGPFFDGLTFHRVVDDFVVQGGDPLGNGTGGPGYRFRDEVSWQLKHERPGILSMANSGPDSNGSQFFITLKATPWLDGKHSVFGEVIEGMEVVRKIQKGDKMERVTILRVGKKYQSYKVSQSDFEALALATEQAIKEIRTSKVKNFIDKNWPKAKKTSSGAYYVILKPGRGATPKKGDTVSVHYTGRLMDGEVFDDSYSRNQPITLPVGEGRVIKGWDEALLKMRLGEKRVLILPPELAYGSRGVGPIPPNSYLVFEMELVDF